MIWKDTYLTLPLQSAKYLRPMHLKTVAYSAYFINL